MKSLRLKDHAIISEVADKIRAELGEFRPEVGMILGSGLGEIATLVTDPIQFPYSELSGFPRLTVEGHAGRLVLGHLGQKRVAILQGRVHGYESERCDGMAVPVGVLAELGCLDLIVTNSAGSLREDVTPGHVMMITDHINLTGANPLNGASGNGRFVDMTNAYAPELRERFQDVAKSEGLDLAEGVYMWFIGPTFETPAEVRAAKILGADAVGMSTVPEVMLARALGLRVVAFSLITNLAAGLGTEYLSHARTLARAANGAINLKKLLLAYMEDGA
jgi:purine-nucleoside phosphorylase